MTAADDLRSAARYLGDIRKGAAETWLLYRVSSKTDNAATAMRDAELQPNLTLAEAEYEIALQKLRREPDAVEPE